MNSGKIAIIDYGVGNLYSVQRALEVCGANNICICSNPDEVREAHRVILPGVGAFADGMKGLCERGLDSALRDFADSGRPLLGICLGMQLLATSSEEFGEHAGLNLIPGKVKAIPTAGVDGMPLKIPYIGWSPLNCPISASWDGSLIGSVKEDECVYLVHSFCFDPSITADLLATYQYGGFNITAAIAKNNITGLQFHPEKSGRVGLSILSRFLLQEFN